MSASKYVIDLLDEHYDGLPKDDDRFINGIEQYLFDNHIDSFFNEENKNMIKSFLSPLFNMTSEDISKYFICYKVNKKMKFVSNAIFDKAIEKKHGGLISSIDDLEKEFLDCVKDILESNYTTTGDQLLISETLLDIDFIKNNTSNMSIRLAQSK